MVLDDALSEAATPEGALQQVFINETNYLSTNCNGCQAPSSSRAAVSALVALAFALLSSGTVG